MANSHSRGGLAPDEIERGVALIRDALAALEFGSIALTVHEGRIVQIDTVRKQRFGCK